MSVGGSPSSPPPSVRRRPPLPLWPVAAVLLLLAGGTLAYLVTGRPPAPAPTGGPTVSVRPTTTLLVAVRDIARLESTEVQVEKVIDLTDTQSHFFGLVEAKDALLLVAVGEATIGVELGKLGDDDVSMDPKTKVARFRLPRPDVLSSRLDENRTYVYTRSTGLLARRNEQLETRARQEAVAAIERTARSPETIERARVQSERQLRALATALGASDVTFEWH